MNMKNAYRALFLICVLWSFSACSSDGGDNCGAYVRYHMNKSEEVFGLPDMTFDNFKSCIQGAEYDMVVLGDEITRHEEGYKKEYDYTLEVSESRAMLKSEFRHRQTFLNQMAHKQLYTFKPQKNGFVEITNNAIYFMGEKEYDLDNGRIVYFERYGEGRKETVNHPVEVVNENFTCKPNRGKVILMNDNRTCEMSFLQGGCRLVQIYPSYELIGDFYKEGETVVSPPDEKPNVQPQGRLELSPTSVKLGRLGSTVYFSIESNTDWTVFVNNTGDAVNGLKVYPLSGTGNATIAVEYGTVESQFYYQLASINVSYMSYGYKQTKTVNIYRRNLPY